MSSALVRPGTPLQIAGNEAPSTLIRNLDPSATLYVGTGTGVSQYSYDMVLEAGAAYSTPPGAVYVATTAAGGCAIVYSPAGSGLVTPAPSAVGIVGKPTVSIPDGVAINGGVSVTGNVGVSGNVGIAGSVAIAGDVNVLGTVKNKTQQTVDTLINNAQFGFYNENRTLFDNVDVGAYESVTFKFDATQNSVDPNYNTTGLFGLYLLWKDVNGNYISGDYSANGESSIAWYNGQFEWTTKVRGRYVAVCGYSTGQPYTIYPYLTMLGLSQQAVPSFRHAFRNSLYASAGGVYFQDGNLSAGMGKTVGGTVQVNQNGYAIYGVTSFAGRGMMGVYNTGYCQTLLRFPVLFGSIFATQEQLAFAQLNTSASSPFIAPRAPMFVHVGLNGGASGTSKFSMAWE